MPVDPLVEETLLHISEHLGRRGVAYLHLVYELMPTGNMETGEFKQNHVSHAVLAKVRAAFPSAIIWCGGFTSGDSAQAALDTGLVDLIAFGRPYIANPDLAERLKHGGRWQKRTVQPITPDAARWVTRTSRRIRRHAASPRKFNGLLARQTSRLEWSDDPVCRAGFGRPRGLGSRFSVPAKGAPATIRSTRGALPVVGKR